MYRRTKIKKVPLDVPFFYLYWIDQYFWGKFFLFLLRCTVATNCTRDVTNSESNLVWEKDCVAGRLILFCTEYIGLGLTKIIWYDL
jgi:hypothetical protein